MKRIDNYFKRYSTDIVISLLIILSFSSVMYFYSLGDHLLYGDALSRLNISRKIIDNLTPGLGQLGNVWLPLPQILMLPFIWNEHMWHSGIAGTIVSTAAYIVGGVYLYRAAMILSASRWVSLLATCIYALNINLLYYQTTAMSEPLFLCSVIIAIYYFIAWMKDDRKVMCLIYAGTAIGASTLIRYEGLALLAASIPMVILYIWLRHRSIKQVEGKGILYITVAVIGFLIWTAYLTAIFGDPLYWKNYYASAKVVDNNGLHVETFQQGLNFFQAFWKYLTSVVWMNGLIPVLFAIVALPILVYDSVKNKSYYFMPVLLSLSIFLFMILTLQRNTPIEQPILNLSNIFSSHTNTSKEFNLRYGLLMLPMIALLTVYLLKIRFWPLKVLLIGLFLVQVVSYINPQYTIIYQIPISISGSRTNGTMDQHKMVEWLNKNYTSGLIMISALKNDPQMFQLGYDYKTYIHEGTGTYWKESTKYPQRYATWVVMDYSNKDDQVTKFLKDSKQLESNYTIVFESNGVRVYKIKGKPEREIK